MSKVFIITNETYDNGVEILGGHTTREDAQSYEKLSRQWTRGIKQVHEVVITSPKLDAEQVDLLEFLRFEQSGQGDDVKGAWMAIARYADGTTMPPETIINLAGDYKRSIEVLKVFLSEV